MLCVHPTVMTLCQKTIAPMFEVTISQNAI
ncbi:hypothetical protein CBM2623_B90046 [Cupriavidus taiwanensis]|nr:hypothetical protein CBM2623_B90046 [Cupriavidus taiwanensis]